MIIIDTSACRDGAWRPFLDLEHSRVYNETVHWHALFDGEMKFIFHAYFANNDPRQLQLFNITADPHELRDLSKSTKQEDKDEVKKWYDVMVDQFIAEGRDCCGFVDKKNRALLQREVGTTYSPNYPHAPTPTPPGPSPPRPSSLFCTTATAAAMSVGDRIVFDSNNCKSPSAARLCQGFSLQAVGESEWILTTLAPGVPSSDRLCMAPLTSTSTRRAHDAAGAALALMACAPGMTTAGAAGFKLNHNNTGAGHAAKQAILHVASGLCVGSSAKGPPVLEKCDSTTETQQWVFGSSGRFCQGGKCLTVGKKA